MTIPADIQQTRDSAAIPLVADVDGTLIRGDLLIEGAARLLGKSPLKLFALPLWLAGGRARLKRKVAEAAPLPPATLALNPEVLDEITAATAAGRAVWLASAADAGVVAPLAEHVGATGYLASDGRTNLVGRAKAEALVERFGGAGFDYIGDEQRDFAVWRRARRVIGVGLPARLERKLRMLNKDARFLAGAGGSLLDYLRALRPHQWVKNMLVFTPLVAAHETDPGLYLAAASVFAALSACASGTYVLNDLLDLPHDRQHASKRHRPMAAGKVRLAPMIAIGLVLMAGGVATAFLLSTAAGLWILLYLFTTLAYSLWIKRKIYADMVTLALLYTVRILTGSAAVSIALSDWFLAFSIFIFLALATVKRQTELHRLEESNRTALSGRGYLTEDRVVLAALNAASSFAAVVVLMLYINSLELGGRYTRPELLWLICPVLIYWLGRLALLANRGAVHDDPIIFALRDRASRLCALVMLTAFTVASL